ncbi:MAG: hypothetical protein DI565_10170 [Ancylobacter novellus]|uniref:Uncharacterized protein n=1 Tax=Ancylobacter novellus TaxID=921 RepID=A0A2W5KL47_ANCNO|nr:MAG: hypothetical protein DI565_10170 [Ancylobacter novellus]
MRAAFALGAAASLATATSALAVDAGSAGGQTPADPSLQQAVALVSGGVAARPADDPSLPKVEVAPDGDSRKAGGAEATLDALARDCADLGAETICKIALVGEGARKRADRAAAIEAPMTIHVKDAEGREIETRRINLTVDMPEGVQKVSFRHVEENVSLPPPTVSGYGGWTIVVGLEPGDANVASSDEGEVEQAGPARRVKSTKRYRSARAGAVSRARDAAVRRPQQLAGQAAGDPSGVTVSARPLAAPPTVTTTVSGNPMARAAESFTARRDAALDAERVKQAPAARASRPQAAASRQQPRPQTQAAAQTPNQRTAQAN